MQDKNINISVVLPCFNEETTIYRNIDKIYDFLVSYGISSEIIAVNDGSSDNTLAELERVNQKIPLTIISYSRNRGKGFAVKRGILASKNEIVMFLDADLGIPIEELEKFLKEIVNGNDIVIASRFVPGLKIKTSVLWHRRNMEKIFRILRMIILDDYKIRDTQCGFKVFRSRSAKEIFSILKTKRFAFDSEVVFLANKKGYRIKELPITLQNPQKSSIKIIRDPLNMFGDLLKIRINYFLGKYKN
jgi:glycosyltransferase involved in cell wall biosynthesis